MNISQSIAVWRNVFMQAHPWFGTVEWEKLYQMEAAFIPEVNDELDTQNFEKFEEVRFYSSIVFCLTVQKVIIEQFTE